MTLQRLARPLFVLALISGLFVANTAPARADVVLGDYLGTFAGDDSEAALFNNLGVSVFQLAQVKIPNLTDNGLSVLPTDLNGDLEPIAGLWTYTGTSLVDYIVVKAGNQHAVYLYTDANTNNERNIGLWNTIHVGNKGVSHITAYTLKSNIVPEPGSVMVVGFAAALALMRRRIR